jgi:uncharacterized protein involved in exopolysaccharide biosynthesis
VAATKVIPPRFSTGATVWIQESNTRSGPIQADELLDSRNWVELLTTYIVLDPVVQAERLYLQPKKVEDLRLFTNFSLANKYTPGTYELTIDDAGRAFSAAPEQRDPGRRRAGGRFGRERPIGFRWVPPRELLTKGKKVIFTVLTPREASGDLLGRLTPRMNGKNFLRLTLTDRDGPRVASTLNTLVNRFVSVAAELKKENLKKLRLALEDQVQQADVSLKASEEALQAFRINTITLPGEQVIPMAPGLSMTQAPVLGSYFTTKQELDQVRRDRRAIEEVLRRNQAGDLAVDAFQTIRSVQTAPDLKRVLDELSTAEAKRRELLQTYTSEFRDVKNIDERIQDLRKTVIPSYANALVTQLKNNEADLNARITGGSAELQSIPRRTMNEQRLQRDVDGKRVIFANLQNRYEEAKLAEVSAIPDISVLDAAVAPTRPSRNTAMRIIMMGVAGTIAFALALALVIDQLDTRFRYPEQASSGLGLTILGAIPEIKQSRNGRTDPAEASQVIEAFRSIRLNLTHSFDGAGPDRLYGLEPRRRRR